MRTPAGPPSPHGESPQRRSARYARDRRRRRERRGRGIVAGVLAIVVVAAVAVLSSPLVPDQWPAETAEEGSATTAAVTASTAVGPSTVAGPGPNVTVSTGLPRTSVAGSALLVVTQDGKPALVALFYAGPKGGAVLGMPGVTLFRSGDRFACWPKSTRSTRLRRWPESSRVRCRCPRGPSRP